MIRRYINTYKRSNNIKSLTGVASQIIKPTKNSNIVSCSTSTDRSRKNNLTGAAILSVTTKVET
jgi:hypothetical protein